MITSLDIKKLDVLLYKKSKPGVVDVYNEMYAMIGTFNKEVGGVRPILETKLL